MNRLAKSAGCGNFVTLDEALAPNGTNFSVSGRFVPLDAGAAPRGTKFPVFLGSESDVLRAARDAAAARS
jgi:hypothetical protein